MLTLEFTPESKRIIANWGKDKTDKLNRVRLKWVAGMEGFMLGSANRSFILQKQVGGDPWPVNSDGWKIRKVQLGARTTKTNIFTGAMMRSISSSKTGFTATVGSPVEHAIKVVQYGAPFLPDDKYVINYGQKLFEDLLKQAM